MSIYTLFMCTIHHKLQPKTHEVGDASSAHSPVLFQALCLYRSQVGEEVAGPNSSVVVVDATALEEVAEAAVDDGREDGGVLVLHWLPLLDRNVT